MPRKRKSVTMPKRKSPSEKGEAEPSAPAPATGKRTREDASTKKGDKKRQKIDPLNRAPRVRLNVYVFGGNENGELGLGPTSAKEVVRPRLNPLLSAKSVGVVQLAVGGMHCAALTHDSRILTWGVNDLGALGRDTTWDGGLVDVGDAEDDVDAERNPKESTPGEVDMTNVPDDTIFVQITAGDSCTFALTDEGAVYGWGTFRSAHGDIRFRRDIRIQRIPLLIPELEEVVKIEAGCNHVLALTAVGRLYNWGFSDQDQLGRRVMERQRGEWPSLTPRKLFLKRVVEIGVGSDHSFAITENETVFAWGANNFGQTANVRGAGKNAATTTVPTPIAGLTKISQIIGGNTHSVALTTRGDCYVWGRLDTSAAGVDMKNLPEEGVMYDKEGKPRIIIKPACLPDLKFRFIAAGGDHSLAISQRDGRPISWGFNSNHQTGHNVDDEVDTPTQIDCKSTRNKEFCWAGAGGQFSLLAEEVGGEKDDGDEE